MVEQIVEIAREAGAVIMEHFNAGLTDFESKSDNSPVTQADLDAHKIIAERLAKVSALPIQSEEAPVPYEQRKSWKDFWLVDPLDGTHEFVNRRATFAVLIARVTNGVPDLGVLHLPATGETYYSESGRGAHLEHAGSTVRLPASRRHCGLCC